MEKEFIPYEQALDLKELGFDEDGLGMYSKNGSVLPLVPYTSEDKAILFSQAFRWFREEYGLIGFISFHVKSTFRIETLPHSNIKLNSYKEKYFDNNGKMWNTYEDAELECLKKLIEIVKGK